MLLLSTIEDEAIQKFASINCCVQFTNEKNMDLMIKLIFHDSLLRIYAYPKTSYGESFTEQELELEYDAY